MMKREKHGLLNKENSHCAVRIILIILFLTPMAVILLVKGALAVWKRRPFGTIK